MRVQNSRRLAGSKFVSALLAGLFLVRNGDAFAGEPSLALTNVAQLSGVASQNPTNSFNLHLEGIVLWASVGGGKLVLQDASGAEELELADNRRVLEPGERVRVQGDATVIRSGALYRIGANHPVVDNDGVHAMIEKSGAVYLPAGRQPIEVDWFNGVEKSGLEIEYETAGQPRQKISPANLFLLERAADGTSNWVNGLEFSGFEGLWEALPDFDQLVPVKRGFVNDFDITVVSRSEHAGLRFRGFLKIPASGLYTFNLKSDDGSRLSVGEATVHLFAIGQAELPKPVRIIAGQILPEGGENQWSEVEGLVAFAAGDKTGLTLELRSGAGRMRVDVSDATGFSATQFLNRRVRAAGVCQSTHTPDGQRMAGALLVSNARQIQVRRPALNPEQAANSQTNSGPLPELTSAVEVHRLKRDQAQRGYPVRIRGVVTSVLPEHQAFTIQDSTRGLYVEDPSASRPTPPKPGEFVEVEGTTDPKFFAPIVRARRVSSLAAGELPDPAHPTWDQLVNGSMDAQYVEIQGIVTDGQTNRVTIRTEGGVVEVELRLAGAENADFRPYENALVRLRGCLFASWDYVTHQVSPGDVKVYNASISVDQPPPAELFSIPAKTVPELRLFDPQASVFQRVKVSGQIVFVRGNECFLMQGDHGIRFVTKNALGFQAGDLVKVVGFPDVYGTVAPGLRDAIARRSGHAALPPPRKLPADDLLKAEYDATLVRVEGALVNVRTIGEEHVFEMQSGVRNFVARLAGAGNLSLTPGSRLELTGVYAAQPGNRNGGLEVGSFELLLKDAAAIKILARPPWWTLERLLVMVGALALGLAVTVLWITQLRRKVEERTAELSRQIQERQQVEHQREMEQERSRIAQDLHDELGSGITEIGMLAARAKSATAAEEKRSHYLEQMGGKAREMVIALDEIVWAMNPRHDSLGSLISYFSLYADRFLSLANISWRLAESSDAPDHTVSSRHRHQLFLVFKEALTNVVRHSGATEVTLSIRYENGELRLSIADNGRGLPSERRTEEMDGVVNMRERIERLDGRFEVSSGVGAGTVVRLAVPAK